MPWLCQLVHFSVCCLATECQWLLSCVVSSALALSASSPLSVLPSSRMSTASCLPNIPCVVSSALALSASSPLRVLPSNRMSMASYLPNIPWVVSSALALSASSPLSVLPSNRMSMASCLLLSRKLLWMVLVAVLAASEAWKVINLCG